MRTTSGICRRDQRKQYPTVLSEVGAFLCAGKRKGKSCKNQGSGTKCGMANGIQDRIARYREVGNRRWRCCERRQWGALGTWHGERTLHSGSERERAVVVERVLE